MNNKKFSHGLGTGRGRWLSVSISRNFDQYLADHGLVQLAEVIPESECQEFCPADSWYEGQIGERGTSEVTEDGAPAENFSDKSSGDELARAKRMIEGVLGS
ncbi:hypothetical protein CpMB16_08425 [Corynebacterium pseudotuberculosis]|uniref:Uncharacterized protein n=1 Tax=Corynebacterium pseudotuberculosis 258 TaxID=1168865 RepID=A0AAU8PP88_CORPS|nr:hypothetical protein [Corynebacterium pseudotuberculosis]AEQ07177.1 hypothetical protein CPCIP5297_08420 [Corynebacterium pseudotuberculosis CIP 52.97]AFB72992.2 hypothetical protein CP316_08410 [Corynebacterium pseudotuberculosis 316]AFH91445.2 hypothetical protein CP31_08630 [Corynebacterium pseudotuberculosis 31]AFK17279.2 hypothetical protein CP258_08420 [Corynebacterium pseudotuberculosis 258]AMN70511.1 hypothetical protein ATN02_08710 [Corynebacterium pseudotuberculosis]